MKVEACCGLEKYAQVISSEMMEALKASAFARGVSLDMEIALRLMAGMSEPELGEGNSLYQSIMRCDFSADEAVAECKRKRQAALYLYEMEKLKLFLQFEKSLPRQMKESFMMIDVKEATKQIKAELAGIDKTKEED